MSPHPAEIAIDNVSTQHRRMFWIDSEINWIMSASLDGSNVERLYQVPIGTLGLGYDSVLDQVFWTEPQPKGKSQSRVFMRGPADASSSAVAMFALDGNGPFAVLTRTTGEELDATVNFETKQAAILQGIEARKHAHTKADALVASQTATTNAQKATAANEVKTTTESTNRMKANAKASVAAEKLKKSAQIQAANRTAKQTTDTADAKAAEIRKTAKEKGARHSLEGNEGQQRRSSETPQSQTEEALMSSYSCL